MKSAATSRKARPSPEEIEALVAQAPGEDRPLTAGEAARWEAGVFVEGGGYAKVRQALAAKRQRGSQVAPTKKLVSVRYSPEVLDFFKASGAGWQTRMDEVLKRWVARQTKAKSPQV
jgi:uncharacterized protein (DUF4415 family)